MFQSARLKLTATYLIIIMLISSCFSVVIYRELTQELDRLERGQRLRLQRQLQQELSLPPEIRAQLPQPPVIDFAPLNEARERITLSLILINAAILGVSGLAGYFLAGRTLRPIQQMVDEQNRFTSDASHELKTPLTILRSEIEVNLRDPKLTLTQAKQLLQSNLEEIINMQNLSDNLLKLSHQRSLPKVRSLQSVDLSILAQEVINKITPLAKHKKITIKNNVSAIEIEGETSSLEELLIIFLDNAIKYTPSGGKVTISAKKEHTNAVMSIKDTGIGIAQEDIHHLFDRFFRADQSRSKNQVPGYGLGLSIAQKIIQEHHGHIDIESQVGKGTTFTITLPISQRDPLSAISQFHLVH